ncbi:MAG TPA: hypothetical protein ENK43_12595 [Planctomycetes bacterium]|nr:hypothetical protein [Planctomycetota bacterium]
MGIETFFQLVHQLRPLIQHIVLIQTTGGQLIFREEEVGHPFFQIELHLEGGHAKGDGFFPGQQRDLDALLAGLLHEASKELLLGAAPPLRTPSSKVGQQLFQTDGLPILRPKLLLHLRERLFRLFQVIPNGGLGQRSESRGGLGPQLGGDLQVPLDLSASLPRRGSGIGVRLGFLAHGVRRLQSRRLFGGRGPIIGQQRR